MHPPVVALFYKRLIALGGAEVLLSEHYAYLKAHGYAPKIICFEAADLDRINIDAADLVVVRGRSTVWQTYQLARLLKDLQPNQTFCHSGYIEFGLAARLAGISYSIFVHQPTTMSYNESDKFARPYFDKYKKFARKDTMFNHIVAAHDALSIHQRLRINLRASISQNVLRRAENLFVLSNYAVREKKEIFGLDARYLSGAISERRLEGLTAKPAANGCADTATLVSVSRLDENKRIDVLIDAIAILRDRGHSIRLLLGGSGPASDDLQAHVAALELEEQVIFLGFVPEKDIPDLYSSMDLFATIDWADFRITTYEVLSENRRVIVSDDTDVDQSLLESGYLFVAPADGEKLASEIARALATTPVWNTSRLQGYLRNYTWSAYFGKIERVMLDHA